MHTTESIGAPYDAATAGLAPSRMMRARFLREVSGTGLPAPSEREKKNTQPTTIVEAAMLAPFPAAAQRYLRFMDVIGRPRTWSFRARALGAFRMGPDKPWASCEAWQYDTRDIEGDGVARIFHMRMRMASVVPVLVRDTYLRGHGRMLGRILETVSVVDQADEMIAIGELVTYLNDCILFAPSMLLGPETTWSAVDDDDSSAFDVTLRDHGRTVTARVFIDEIGRATDFSTTDRFGTDPETKKMIRARWSTPIAGWTTTRDGRPIAKAAKAIWHFASGDLAYADFHLDMNELSFDVAAASPEDKDEHEHEHEHEDDDEDEDDDNSKKGGYSHAY